MSQQDRTPHHEDAPTTRFVDPTNAVASPQLVVMTDKTIRTYHLPASGHASIGRAPTNDICIDHPSVSRRHAILHVGPPFLIEDLGGANGTFVRRPGRPEEDVGSAGIKVHRRSIEVDVGDSITLGAILVVLHRASGEMTRKKATAGPPPKPHDDRGIIVRDPALKAIYEQAYRAAASGISVLLLGETGVGKEVLARAVHDSSPRAGRPFLGLNCAALSESLLESELFGHEKGAFTGALQARAGLFESAHGGTVFLDEVGELPLSFQVKLLRVLEQREVLRVGGRTPHRLDVRFVCATNRDLEAEVARGTFRQDLFFRLNGITLTIPPLRERTSEIAPLAERFAAGACEQSERPKVPVLSADTLSALQRYRWPGNIRELRNVIERAVVLCTGDTVGLEHLPAAIAGGAAESSAPGQVKSTPHVDAAGEARSGADAEADERASSARDPRSSEGRRSGAGADSTERERIVRALEQCAGNQTRAAELLGISRRTLVSRIKDYDLPRPLKARG